MSTKFCSKCHTILNIIEFNKNRYRVDKLQSFCKKCQSEAQKRRYHSAPGKIAQLARIRTRNANIRKMRREVIRAAKDVPCTDCQVRYPHYVMDFDHLRDKIYTIGEALWLNKELLLKEIEKCEVVCSNCHRERTEKRRIESLAQLVEQRALNAKVVGSSPTGFTYG